MRCIYTLLSFALLLLSTTAHAQFPCLGGTSIETVTGSDTLDLCNQGADGVIEFTTSTGALPFAYVVVDAAGNIVYIDTGREIDFSELSGGPFQVYAFNFIGNLSAEIGEPFNGAILADGCFTLTDNFVTITGQAIEGGTVSTEGGETEVFTCPGDGIPDLIRFDSTGADPSASYTYVVTDENNIILSVPAGDEVDFEEIDADVIRVWGLAYTGNLTAEVGDDASQVQLADVCAALSENFVTVFREAPDGGTVIAEGGAEDLSLCVGGGNEVVPFDSMDTSNGLYTYVVTDTNNIILELPSGDLVDFSDNDPGVYRVWGLAYTGNITAAVGDTASAVQLTDECFDLSDNFVTIVLEQANGGTVSTEDGDTDIFVCVGDGQPDLVSFDSAGVTGPLFTYVLTDTNNVILDVPGGDLIDFEDTGAGTVRVWGLAYSGDILAMPGDTASAVALTDGCFDLSDNFVTVNRGEPSGGTVSTEDGATEVFTCPGDSIPDIVRFDSMGVAGPNFTYVITDDANVILGLPGSDFNDFEDAGTGTCRVWGLAYSGDIIAMPGDTASAVDLSNGCFDLSNNFITVYREQPDGGSVSTEAGETVVYTCPGDGVPDVINFDSAGVSNSLFTYVITDDANVILGVPGSDFNDFEDAGIGTCRVWGLAYTGNITAMAGDTASAVPLTDECFDLSDNFITVYREQPEGGTVSTEMGMDTVNVCVGDGQPDVVQFDSAGVSNSLFTYVITDADNVILAVPSTDMADFEDIDGETLRVWGLAYTGNITAMAGDTASAVALTDGCFDLSDNFILVNRDEVDGGMVSTETGMDTVNVCVGDGVPDIIRFDSSGTAGPNFTYVITDDANVILAVPAADSSDFEDAAGGVCRVWGLSYSGNITAMAGDTASAIALTDGCFDLSDNFIVVNREAVNGGTVSTEDGATEVSVCLDDGEPDIIRFDSSGVEGPNFTYVITDENNVIRAVPGGDFNDFENNAEGVLRVWGLAYSGNITAMLGDTASAVMLSNGCFDLSDNFITVTIAPVNGGSVTTEGGATVAYTCPGDGNADFIQFDSTGVSGASFTYVVTDEANVIQDLIAGDTYDFEDGADATLRVWGLAYTGTITAMVGDTASAVALSDGCFDLSNGFVTIFREQPDGGTVSTEDDETEVYTCPGDGIADLVQFDSMGTSNSLYTYVITDENNVILDLPGSDMADFEDAGTGTCRVWGLAYTGNITAMAGDTASAVPLTDECFDLSDNFIIVYREQPEGGTVSTETGLDSVSVCVGDGMPDVIRFDSTGVGNSLYTYVITDETNVILGVPGGDSNDFEDAEGGVCRVWGLAYTGNITAMAGDTASAVALTDECFDLSDNFITVIREAIGGGTVMTESGDSIVYTCPGDTLPDLVLADSTDTVGESFSYVVTDTNNVILNVPATDTISFTDAEPGVCRIWGLSYSGDLIAMLGDTASVIDLSDGCFDLSDNFITVYREQPDGGTVATAAGSAQDTACVSDDFSGVILMDSVDASQSLYTYVVTDTNNTILSLPPTDEVSFEGLEGGPFRIWGLAYTGQITAEVGDTASLVPLSDDCFDLSDNFVTVVLDNVEAGRVFLDDQSFITFLCPNDTIPDIIRVDSLGVEADNFVYVLTDTNNVSLGATPEDIFNLTNFQEGTYRIWGIGYGDEQPFAIADTLVPPAQSDLCYDLSQNFVTVVIQAPDGGSVITEDGEVEIEVTINDGLNDFVAFDSIGASNSPYTYVVTDENNVILDVPIGDVINFEGQDPGICRVWGLAYTGILIAQPGDTASTALLTTDCYNLSENFVQVNRVENLDGEDDPVLLRSWPNPASDVLWVEIEAPQQRNSGVQATIEIISLTGNVLQSRRLLPGAQQAELDISQLNSGTYWVRYRSEHTVQTEQFVKQR